MKDPEKNVLAEYLWFLSLGLHPVRQHPDPRNLSERLKGPDVLSIYFPALFFVSVNWIAFHASVVSVKQQERLFDSVHV